MDSKVSKKDPLQAVILTDDFTTSMTPLEKVYPSILMPVINLPLLDYMLETLTQSKVEEVFIYCNSHMDFFKQCMIGKDDSGITITVIYSDSIRCVGDALRDMYGKGCLRGHFILLRGNSFINTDLCDLVNVHRSIAEKDKGAAMTMVLRNIGSTKDTPFNEETTLVVNDKANKILHYEKLRDREKKVKMKMSWFLSHDEVRVSTCFLDTHVYICSPSTLSLFADNFDFQTMEDFIRGVLMGDEILDSRIYFQELNPDDYALAVTSWNIYHTLIKDSFHRFTYPVTPDCFPFSKDIMYNVLNSTYKHKNANLSKGCLLERECFVGRNIILGDNNTVSTSVLMCHIVTGNHVYIRDSYVFPNVRIEDNCIIKSSILFSNCVVKSGSKIDGCILCPEVVVPPNSKYTDAFVESAQHFTTLSELNGKDGFYYFNNNVAESDVSSTESSSSDSDPDSCELPDDTNMFLSEVIDSLLRGYQDKVKCENLILEINSSRYAYNISVREVTYNVVKAILSLPLHYLTEIVSPITNKSYQTHLKAIIIYFNAIILNYVKNGDAQEDCLRAIEDVASTTDELLPYTPRLLHDFYNRDILSEEKILEWHESEIEDTDVHRKKVKDAVVSVIQWLREAEEDSSESSNS